MAAGHQQQMNIEKLYGMVAQIKDMIDQNKQQAREILIENPDLCRDLFKAQIMLGMVKPPEADGPCLGTDHSNSTGTSVLANREASFGHVMPGETTGDTHIPRTSIITPGPLATIIDSPLSPDGTYLGTDCSNLSFGKKEMEAVHTEREAPLEPYMPGRTIGRTQILGRTTIGSDQIAQNIDSRLTPDAPYPGSDYGNTAHTSLPAKRKAPWGSDIPKRKIVGAQIADTLPIRHGWTVPIHDDQTVLSSSSQAPDGPYMETDNGSNTGTTDLTCLKNNHKTRILGTPQIGPDQMTSSISSQPPLLTAEIEQVLLNELKNLTPEQINLLPAVLRQPVIQLQEVHRQWELNFL